MNGYEKRTQEKKAAIIKAAQELFAEKGVRLVSVSDIAERAGVSRVTLFKYFGDKDGLAREAMRSWIEVLIGEYRAVVASDKPFPDKLQALLSLRILRREKIGEQFITTTAWDDPELQRLIFGMARNDAFSIIRDFLRQGRECGFIDAGLEEEAVLTYISAIAPLIQNPEYIKKGASFHTSLFNLFMGGLVKGWYRIKEADAQ